MQWVELWDAVEKYHRNKQLMVTTIGVVKQDITCYRPLAYDNTEPAFHFVS